MRRADLIAAVLLFALAAGYLYVAIADYPYLGPNGPASGFLPVWLGIAMGILSVLLFVGALRTAPGNEDWIPDRHGLWRLIITLGGAIVFVSLLEVVGMVLGCALFLVAVLRFFEDYPWKHAVAVAVAAGAAIWLVFVRWLQVPFPEGFLGF